LSSVKYWRLVQPVAVIALAVGALACGATAPTRPTASPQPSQPVVVALPTQLADVVPFEQTLPLFEYDRRVPFNVEQTAAYPRGDATIGDITYTGANGSAVPAYVVTPGGKRPFAGVIWMGWTGDYAEIRDEFVEEAMLMAGHGVVSLLVSGYFPWHIAPTDKDADRMAVIGQIRELRRAIDLLLAQPGVDPNRIAFVGHSMGAMHGVDLVAVDHRVKAAVLMAPHETLTDWIFQGYGLDPVDRNAYQTAMASFDPIAFVSHASPTTLFFQFGSDDSFVPRSVGQHLYDTASEPKKIGWYGGGHALDARAKAERTAWLVTSLNLKT
jgi:dienelactone hydrolase